MTNKILADFIVFVHLAYVAFALVGLLLTLLGLALRWQWVRNLRFRVIHLVMVEVVALEGLFNIRCPLTDLEAVLRASNRMEPAVLAHATFLPRAAHADDWFIDEANDDGEFQPVFQQLDPAIAVEPPPALPLTQPSEEPAETFVGWLLGSILYVQVPQATLDRWYVVFGIVTLVVFVAFPPRRGTWSERGFLSMILLWIGGVFFAATLYDYWLGNSIPDPMPPLVAGAAIVVLGIWCALVAISSRPHATTSA